MSTRSADIFLGALFYLLLLGIALWYQLQHGSWFQAVAGAILISLTLYVAVVALRDDAKPKVSDLYLVGAAKSKRTFATMVTIGLCCAASIIGWMLPNNWYIREGTIGRSGILVHHEWWRLATAPFLHATGMHLWMNMAALWYLGSEIETLLGTTRFVAIYAAAALGGDLAVVAFGQEHTLGASGAIYGLMGATLFFGWEAWNHGFRSTARRLLTASGLVIGLNLLFTLAIPNISLAGHLGGLVAGLLVSIALGIPGPLKLAWALTDACPRQISYSCDAAGTMYYQGPLRFALQAQFVSVRDVATAVDKNTWPQMLLVADADPDHLIISCPVPAEKLPSSKTVASPA